MRISMFISLLLFHIELARSYSISHLLLNSLLNRGKVQKDAYLLQGVYCSKRHKKERQRKGKDFFRVGYIPCRFLFLFKPLLSVVYKSFGTIFWADVNQFVVHLPLGHRIALGFRATFWVSRYSSSGKCWFKILKPGRYIVILKIYCTQI